LPQTAVKSISPSSSSIALTVEPSAAITYSHSETSAESVNEIMTIEAETTSPNVSPPQSRWGKEVEIFTSTFFTIFLAELGDKTQLTTLLMAAESHAPWIVFAGAGSALVATSLLGVLLGSWLAKRVSPRTLERSAGILLLCISALLVLDILRS
jgi:putative Ca2+/H+ antiporter (TMEM165/GDT1 family)